VVVHLLCASGAVVPQVAFVARLADFQVAVPVQLRELVRVEPAAQVQAVRVLADQKFQQASFF